MQPRLVRSTLVVTQFTCLVTPRFCVEQNWCDGCLARIAASFITFDCVSISMSVSPLTCTMSCVLNLRQNPDATTFRKKMRCLVEGEWLLTNTAEYCYLAAFFHLAFCVTSTIAVSPLLRRARNMFVDKWGRRRFDVELQLRRTIFWFFAFELQFLSCSQDATCLASWQCIRTSQVAMPLRHGSEIKTSLSLCINNLIHQSSSLIFKYFLFHPLLIYSLLLFFRATLSSSWCLLNLMIFGPSHGAMWEHMTMRIMLLVWAVLAKMRLFTIGFLTCPDGAFGTDSEWMMCISTGNRLVYPNLDVFFGQRATKRTLRTEFWDRWLLWQPPVLASIHMKLWSLVSLDRCAQIWQTICSLGLMFTPE